MQSHSLSTDSHQANLFDDEKIRELNSAFQNLMFSKSLLTWMANNNAYDYMGLLEKDLTEIWIPCVAFSASFSRSKLIAIFDALHPHINKLSLDGTASSVDEEKVYVNQMIKILKAAKFAKYVNAINLSQNQLFTKPHASFAKLMRAIPTFVKSLDLSRNNPFDALTSPTKLKTKLALIPEQISDLDMSYNLLSHIAIGRTMALKDALSVLTKSQTILFTNLEGNLLQAIGGEFGKWLDEQIFIDYSSNSSYSDDSSYSTPDFFNETEPLLADAERQLIELESEFEPNEINANGILDSNFDPASEESFAENATNRLSPTTHIHFHYSNQRFFSARRMTPPPLHLSSSSDSLNANSSEPDVDDILHQGYSSF